MCLFERLKKKNKREEKAPGASFIFSFISVSVWYFKLCIYGSVSVGQHSVLYYYFMFCYGRHWKKLMFSMGNKLVF